MANKSNKITSLLNRGIAFIKKNGKKMITEEELISYKQNFTGQQFQWIKTDRPELLGKVVKCRDVNPVGNKVIAFFDDNSQVDVNEITNRLMMIHDDMPPLSKAEVESIYAPKKPVTPPPVDRPSSAPRNEAVPVQSSEIKPRQQDKANPFELLNSDVTSLTLKLDIKLPDKKLLKLMYASSKDKNDFIDQLSKYVSSMINNKVINESLKKMLDDKPANKNVSAGSGVKITEVKSND